MKIFKSLDVPFSIPNPVVTVGVFDGVHLGHKALFQQLNATAHALNGESVVVTFDPHPRQVLQPEEPFLLLNTLEKKLQLLDYYHIDNVVLIPFTKEFAARSYENFLQEIIIATLHARVLVMGPHHNFGKNREGNFEKAQTLCASFGVQVEKIPELVLADIAVHSSQIRKLLAAGRQAEAEKLLGYSL